MGINVEKVLLTVQDISSKNQSGGYLSPNEFNNFAALAQREAVSEVIQLLDLNRTATILIEPVIKVDSVSITDNYIDKPKDYRQMVAFYTKYFSAGKWSKREAEYLNHTEIGDRLISKIDPPELNYPIVVGDKLGLRVYPDELVTGELVYVYDYPDPIYAVDASDPPVYDPVASVDFVLSELFFDMIVYKICLLFGISIKDANLQQTTARSVLKTL